MVFNCIPTIGKHFALLAFFLAQFVSTTANASPPRLPPCPGFYFSESAITLAEKLIAETDHNSRRCHADRISQLGEAAIPIWSAFLDSPDGEIRNHALHYFSHRISEEFGSRSISGRQDKNDLPTEVVTKFILQSVASARGHGNGCDGKDLEFRGDVGVDAIPQLISLLDSDRDHVPASAAACLTALGPSSSRAIPELIRVKKTRGIHKIGIFTPTAFNSMRELDGYGSRYDMLNFDPLPPRMASSLRPAILQSKDRTDSYHSDLFSNLSSALGNIRTEEAASILIEAKAFGCYDDIYGQYAKTDQNLVYCPLANVGPAAVPLLIAYLDHTTDLTERIKIARILWNIESAEAKQAAQGIVGQAMPFLLRELTTPGEDEDPLSGLAGLSSYQDESVRRFRILGPLARSATSALLSLLDNSSVEIRARAARALGYIEAFEAEEALIKMRDNSRDVGDDGKNEGFGIKPETRAANIALGDLYAARDYLKNQTDAKLVSLAANGKISAISELYRRGPSSVPALLEVVSRTLADLSDYQESGVLEVALQALFDFGGAAKDALPQLARYLNHPVMQYKLGSPLSDIFLARIGFHSNEEIEVLFRQVIDNESPAGRWYSAQVLGELTPLPPKMAARLKEILEQEEFWKYGGGKPPESLVSALTPISATTEIHQPLAPAGPLLDRIKVLAGYPCTTAAACKAPSITEERAEDLIPFLAYDDKRIRQTVIGAFGDMGTDGKKAIPYLIKFLDSGDFGERAAAADTLLKLSMHPSPLPELLRYLLHASESENAVERHWAAAMLAEIDPLPAHVVPVIKRLLNHPNVSDVQGYLLRALSNIHSRESASVLTTYLVASKSQMQRDNTVSALLRCGAAAEPPVVALMPQLKDIDTKISVAQFLAKRESTIGKQKSNEILNDVLLQLEQEMEASDTADVWNVEIRRNAAKRSARLVTVSAKAVAILRQASTNTDPYIREIAISALGKNPEEPGVVGLLEKAQLDRNWAVRLAANKALAKHAIPSSPIRHWMRCGKPSLHMPVYREGCSVKSILLRD